MAQEACTEHHFYRVALLEVIYVSVIVGFQWLIVEFVHTTYAILSVQLVTRYS